MSGFPRFLRETSDFFLQKKNLLMTEDVPGVKMAVFSLGYEHKVFPAVV